MKTTRTQFSRGITLSFLLFSGLFSMSAQNQVIPLWDKIPDEVKAANYKEKPELKDGKVQSTSQVSVPTLSIFIPKETKPNQTAVVICPGGGYTHLAFDKEGTKVAEWFNSLGITAFVLKYRMPTDLTMKNKNVGLCKMLRKPFAT
ncbi:alpha/beta hydrolase [Flavobacterium sp. MMS24-S5]|uniref:alpha/beta hydrolase n=1 Tax=Flavobacterium sp. MMS24-S5 TaxID=3416605 RepID=UPI003D0762AE